MKWLLVCSLWLAVAGLSGCAEKTAVGGTCDRSSECADGLTCARDLTCQTFAKAKEMTVAAEKQ